MEASLFPHKDRRLRSKLRLCSATDPPSVLGHPWIRLHHPDTEWTRKKIHIWNEFCFSTCLFYVQSGLLAKPLNPPMTFHLSRLSPVTWLWFSSKEQAACLPPDRLYEFAIDLLPGTPLPSSRLCNLCQPESGAMGCFRHQLVAGIIHPSLVGGGVSKSFPCTEYHGLNNMTIKNKYPLSLIAAFFKMMMSFVVSILRVLCWWVPTASSRPG